MSKKSPIEVDCYMNYQMIAIVSHLKDYVLCYNVNINLNFDLIKYDDLKIVSDVSDESNFSWYYFYDEISRTSYYLLGNKCEKGNLLKSQKTVDYFLLIKNSVGDEQLKSILDSLRKIPKVMAVFKIDKGKLKKMDMLLEMIELHELDVVR